ncbi:rhamnan synthesis F family protein [Candidatus Rhodobacter oscarellae]|uniref:rhamnan synthesis F family protein n=1 Tax=Candidatus Rhodobacter oscarellae TaxID=1675527 RepID=UPI001364D4BC|nr:rhamnan synthesis F family protein [Candidatus Rhodobacter lobularis]
MFDPAFYRKAHPLLHPVHLRFPLRHYLTQGERSGLQPSPLFSPRAYLRHNSEIGLESFEGALWHYISKGRAQRLVCVDPVPDAAAYGPLAGAPCAPADIAVVVHVFYPKLWAEIEARLHKLQIGFDLYVTVTETAEHAAQLITEIRSAWPRAYVVAMPNRGRDVLPFTQLVNGGLLSQYQAVCKLHTKASTHLRDGAGWRNALLEGVLPSEDAPAMLRSFLSDPHAALLVPEGHAYDGPGHWGANRARVEALIKRLRPGQMPARFSFPAGTVCWIKAPVIAQLVALALQVEEFEPEWGQTDGTLAHGVERLLGVLAADLGLSVATPSALARASSPAFSASETVA